MFPDARSRNARLGFALIYPDRHGRNVMRVVRIAPGPLNISTARSRGQRATAELSADVGTLLWLQVGQVHASRIGDDDNKSLKQVKFQTGDLLDVAVF